MYSCGLHTSLWSITKGGGAVEGLRDPVHERGKEWIVEGLIALHVKPVAVAHVSPSAVCSFGRVFEHTHLTYMY